MWKCEKGELILIELNYFQDEYNLHQTGVRVVGLGSGPFQSKQLVLAEQLTKRTTQDHKLKFEKMPNLMR